MKIKLPDIGDFTNVDIIEILVEVGQIVNKNDHLISLETDKASIEVPAEHDGEVLTIDVSIGDKISQGDLILTMKTHNQNDSSKKKESARIHNKPLDSNTVNTDLLVLGAGPGGYTAAFRAADLGLNVTLVERWPVLGGVCLNVGCIPSKALLHAAKVIDDAAAMEDHGIKFSKPKIMPKVLNSWKESIIKKLTTGLEQLANQRKVNVVHGTGKFTSPNKIILNDKDIISFKQCIIAVGSESASLPEMPDDERIMNSSSALEINSIPKNLLVVGGGIIGLEMACVYSSLGAEVTIVELTDSLMPETDADLVKPYLEIINNRYKEILLNTKVKKMRSISSGIKVTFEANKKEETKSYERVLVAVGRRSNGLDIDLDNAKVDIDTRGIIAVDKQMKTNQAHIFAIGDITGNPMLAHKAEEDGIAAVEIMAGQAGHVDYDLVPGIVYTHPEAASVGKTEEQLVEGGISYKSGQFPMRALGRSRASGDTDGFVKILSDATTDEILGAHMVGARCADLIAEMVVAMEFRASAEDIARMSHAHPTYAEAIKEAALAATADRALHI